MALGSLRSIGSVGEITARTGFPQSHVSAAVARPRGWSQPPSCGLFHVFDDEDRPRFIDGIRAAIRPGGRYYMLCFSDRQSGHSGPRRVTQDEIRASFDHGWQVDSIEPATFDLTIDRGGALAWLAAITRR